MDNKRPLVSLTVIAYKAEQFIEEAIEGALAQSYQPLEIIFSDDCSPDRTFEIMQEKTKNYRGPHKLVLNRNDENLGISGHINKVWFDIAQGDWIVVSAGDDISLSNRVETIMQNVDEDTGVLHHTCIQIDEEGNQSKTHFTVPESILNIFIKRDIDKTISNCAWFNGASACFNSKMLAKYGKLNNDVVNEDSVWAYRAIDFGELVYLNIPLMKYRKHQAGITHVSSNKWTKESYIDHQIKYSFWEYSYYKQVLSEETIKLSAETIEFSKQKVVKNSKKLHIYGCEGVYDLGFKPNLRNQIFFIKERIKLAFLPLHLWMLNVLNLDK